jgi:hypothetical protein
MPKRGKGKLLDLPASCALPDLGLLDGNPPWAAVRVGWNPTGLGIAVEVTGKTGRTGPTADDPNFGDGVQVWIDTRDTRDVHRATRFCHRFSAILLPEPNIKTLSVRVHQLSIHRAIAEPPRTSTADVLARAEQSRASWRLELFFKAAALAGFDPETNRRLGFMIQVVDPGRGDQFLGVGREFPVAEDPSLWATLELRDEQGGGA